MTNNTQTVTKNTRIIAKKPAITGEVKILNQQGVSDVYSFATQEIAAQLTPGKTYSLTFNDLGTRIISIN